jgi:hypothetical protein
VLVLKLDEVVCAYSFFKRRRAKPILQAIVVEWLLVSRGIVAKLAAWGTM